MNWQAKYKIPNELHHFCYISVSLKVLIGDFPGRNWVATRGQHQSDVQTEARTNRTGTIAVQMVFAALDQSSDISAERTSECIMLVNCLSTLADQIQDQMVMTMILRRIDQAPIPLSHFKGILYDWSVSHKHTNSNYMSTSKCVNTAFHPREIYSWLERCRISSLSALPWTILEKLELVTGLFHLSYSLHVATISLRNRWSHIISVQENTCNSDTSTTYTLYLWKNDYLQNVIFSVLITSVKFDIS